MGWIGGALAMIVVALSGDPTPFAPGASGPGRSQDVEFNRDIRPILSDRCYQCHGPDGANARPTCGWIKSRRPRACATAGVRSLPATSTPASSTNGSRPRTFRSGCHPSSRGKPSAPTEVERIGRWITEGAKWEPHWSFVVPKSMPVPLVRDQRLAPQPDRCVYPGSPRTRGATPASETERGILIRRVTLDLTGLPPTRAEIRAFENDNGPNAYEKVVDRLLGSPAVGERLASRWLNAARYADTSGYQTDGPRIMWRWRDWVIDAYNQNMPFDRFHHRAARGRPFARGIPRAKACDWVQSQPSRQQ